MLATGDGVLRMHSWPPSVIYHLVLAHMTFQQRLFAGW
jgi:hypothetical protein